MRERDEVIQTTTASVQLQRDAELMAFLDQAGQRWRAWEREEAAGLRGLHEDGPIASRVRRRCALDLARWAWDHLREEPCS